MSNVYAIGPQNEADHGQPGLFLRHVDGQVAPILTNVKAANPGRDRSNAWLRTAMVALSVLAITAAVVSYQAQYRMVLYFKSDRAIAALQAGIPDVSALVFAALGIALALSGKRAIRARLLNVAAVGTSIAMNALAASSGWKAMAIWTLAPVAYAVTSDTLIGVLRSWTIARQKAMNTALADDEATPLAVVGKVFLYGARLVVAPGSTLSGARRAILNSAPVPEKPKADTPAVEAHQVVLRQVGPVEPVPALPAARSPRPVVVQPAKPKTKAARKSTSAPKKSGGESKQARLIRLAVDEHGLASKPLAEVSKLATKLAADVDLHPATARRTLLAHARELQNGGAR